jgi:ketosteroid isomerase-like protein
MQNNLATVSAIYEAFGKGDIPFIISQLANDVQWEKWDDNSAQKAGVPWFKLIQGKEGVMSFFQVIVEKLNITDFKVLNVMAGANQVAATIIIEADVPESGTHFRDEEMHLWSFNEQGKITGLRHYADTHKHIEAYKGVLVNN